MQPKGKKSLGRAMFYMLIPDRECEASKWIIYYTQIQKRIPQTTEMEQLSPASQRGDTTTTKTKTKETQDTWRDVRWIGGV